MEMKKNPSFKQWLISGLTLVFIYFYACGGDKENRQANSSSVQISDPEVVTEPFRSSESESSSEQVKKDVELILGNDYPVVDDVTTAISEADLDELDEFIIANDQEGFTFKVAEKTANGTAFRLAKGTQVRLISRGMFFVKVRVLEGPFQNNMGYFDPEFIKGFDN
jgi:hypothetical protein